MLHFILEWAKQKTIKCFTKSDSHQNLYLIKFANSQDEKDAGAVEYVYSLMAKEAGVDMPETYLFESKYCSGFFGTKRFGIKKNRIKDIGHKHMLA